MGYANFKPTVWSKYIQHELKKFTVFEQDCNYMFKGEVGLGKTVKILGVARPTIGSYTGASIGTPEIIDDSSVYLTIDQAPFFNFQVDDVDEAQSIEGLMPALMEEANRAMAEKRDTYIAGLAASGAGAYSNSLTVDSADDAKLAIDAAITALWKQGLSQKDDVTAYLTPEFYGYFLDKVQNLSTNNPDLLSKGILLRYNGVNIKMSNNVYASGGYDHIIVKSSKAIAFASGIDKVEAYRPETLFSDAVKGLNTFGGKIVRPKEMYVIKAKYA